MKACLKVVVWRRLPVIHALGDGYEVDFVTDASGGVTLECHEVAVQWMIQAGAVPLTTWVFACELQRDWARTEPVAGLSAVLLEHGGGVGTNLAWEWQLLGQSGGAA